MVKNKKKNSMSKKTKRTETRTMWMIFQPDGSMIPNSEFYTRKACIDWAGVGKWTWTQQYREGYRCKKVEVTYKEL